MFNNVALDVVIGLVFIFLLYGLLATIVQEFIAQIFDLRAKMLVKTIRTLLDDREETKKDFLSRWVNHIWSNLYHFFCPLCNNKLSKAFYTHPTIKYLASSSWKSKPSYVGAYNFSSAIIKMFRGKDYDGIEPQMNAIYRTLFENARVVVGESGKNQVTTVIEAETLDHLKQLYLDAQKDIDRFKLLLEKWFDETMERTTGWYKKQTQWILLFIGFVLAVIFNIDTITICKILAKDKTARAQLVEMAIRSTGKYDTLTKQLTRVHVKDSFPVYKKDLTGKIIDSVYNYTTKDTLLLSDTALKGAYKIVTDDIANANSILGLGRSWKDTCQSCEQLKDSIKKSNLSPKRRDSLLNFLNSEDGKKSCEDRCFSQTKWLQWHPMQTGGIATIFGWMLTALAISLGAPFWFDLLNKVVQLRSSVAKPKEADTGGGSSKIPDSSSSVKTVG